jgi:hypothetical protein
MLQTGQSNQKPHPSKTDFRNLTTTLMLLGYPPVNQGINSRTFKKSQTIVDFKKNY